MEKIMHLSTQEQYYPLRSEWVLEENVYLRSFPASTLLLCPIRALTLHPVLHIDCAMTLISDSQPISIFIEMTFLLCLVV